MHSNVFFMLSKLAATMPLGNGGISVYAALRPASHVAQARVNAYSNNQLIHSFINQTHSL